jgi:hypothetical protein
MTAVTKVGETASIHTIGLCERTIRQTCELGQVITCHCSSTISSNGPQPPSPSALPSVAQSYTGSMGQAVASARRLNKPMANLFPTTTIVVRAFPTSLSCRPTILRLDHTNLPFAIQLLLQPLLRLLLHPITLVFETTSCPFTLRRISQLPCKPFGTVP